MMETKTIEVSETVPRRLLTVGTTAIEVRSGLSRVNGEVREQAVLANAEGWQSAPIEHLTYETPGYDVVVVARMVMTR